MKVVFICVSASFFMSDFLNPIGLFASVQVCGAGTLVSVIWLVVYRRRVP
ncbi:MAG: hypothetical protein V2I41_07290 [Pseudomonadales bacterium]|nr:hypothetical protein [Pseudomonadales bacterium]